MAKYQVVGSKLANRRRDRRNAMPAIEIEIEDTTFTTVDWSLGGFLVEPYEGARRLGESFALTIVAHVGDRSYRHRAEAQIMRVDRVEKQLAASFSGLSPEAMDTLEGLITGRLRRMRK